MAAHFELYQSIVFQPSSLSRAQREALAVVVSRVNRCRYCEAHHGTSLAQLPEGDRPLDQQLVAWAERFVTQLEPSSLRRRDDRPA